MGVQLPSEPINRHEQYLAKIAGQAVDIPAEPITREEAYLNAIAHSGGGGGGTDNYNDLKNQPQIGGVTLTGNKSASDLGLATETALADKADKSAVKNEFLGTLEQWNALTVEQRKAYDTYQIKGDYTEGSGGLPDYSTTEQKTGQKWIDGRDVYIRTFDFSSSPVAVAFNNWTSLGVSIPNCDILLKCNATSGVTNLSASGIEFEIKSSENYGLYAEYNQNINIRRIKFIICEYVKESEVS